MPNRPGDESPSFLPPFQIVRDRFKAFAYDTLTIGHGRVGCISRTCDNLIKDNHTDVAAITKYKYETTVMWLDLTKLIDTITYMMAANWELQKFVRNCTETLETLKVSALSNCRPNSSR